MRRLPRQTLVEWTFVACLVVGCAVLSVFQFRWTSEISRVTTERLRSGFNGQVQLLGQAFDEESLGACNQLLPDREPITAANREAVHAARLRQWQAAKPRPIFRRIAVAVPENSAIRLYLLDQTIARLTPANWPPEWSALKDNLARKAAAGSGPPFQDAAGTLIEFPVFRDHLENEWMIFELDLDYIRATWLPDLVRQFLNANGVLLGDVCVHSWLNPGRPIYATGGPIADGAAGTASVRFNGQGWGTQTHSRRGEDDFWVLTARQRPGALEAIAAGARWRNFLVACLLNALTLAAGFALLHYARRARRVSDLHMRFVANASHELRTPLTVIRGAGQNLARGVASSPERIEQYGRFIVQHADQLNHLVEQMLELADVRRLSRAPRQGPVAIRDVLEGAIADTLAETRAAGCKVEPLILSDVPCVRGEPEALRRAFRNLLINAAKYGGGGGWIGVKAMRAPGAENTTVEVRVEDRGPGIPEAEQAHIFEPFSRGSASRERQIAGSGLGLCMVREIVQAYDGSITLQSAPGRGAAFIVRLPSDQRNG